MKIKNVKLIMIIGMLLINLFFGFFFQNILAAVIDLDDMDSDDLKEKLESKTVSGDTLDYLQYSARKRNKAYYEFDVNNMLGKSTNIYDRKV